MKNIYLLLSFFLFSLFSSAQVIEFTDPNFKNALLNITVDSHKAKDLNGDWCVVDTNGNGEIEVSEAENLSVLSVSSQQISNLSEIQYFINLTKFHCTSNQLIELDVSDLTNLSILDCNYNDLMTLEFSGATALTNLYCNGNELSELDITNLSNLMTLECEVNNLTSLDLSNSESLLELICGYNEITDLDVSNLTNLKDLVVDDNELTELDVSNLSNLENLFCSNNNIATLDASNLENLFHIEANSNNMIYLNITNTNLVPYHQVLRLYDSPYNDNAENQNSFQDICCDLEEYVFLSNYVGNYSPDCIFNVGENCSPVYQSQISMNFDLDSDGCDENDETLNNFGINVNSSVQNTNFEFSESSTFTIYSYNESATVTPIINSNYYTITPSFYEVDYTESNFETLEFCVASNGEYYDLEITFIPLNGARPGFEADYKILYKNIGTTTLSGNVQLTFEDDYMDLINATPAEDLQSTNSLSWEYADLAPFEQREIFVTFELNTPTEIEFPLNNWDIISFQVLVNPSDMDETPEDNTTLFNHLVLNSYDPNDKILLEGETITPDMVGEYVHYRIRFENTGTASAINVIVEDTIDPLSFDISTLQVVDASHSVRTVVEGDLVKFQFYNIDLPFDDDNNDGYVVFKIKTLDTLELDDTFSNQAEIYFDYNAPIITNDYTTTVSEVLGVDDIQPNNTFSLSPNPAKDSFQINTQQEIHKLELFDSTGKLVKTFLGNTQTYHISELQNGIYLLKIYTENEAQTIKLIKN